MRRRLELTGVIRCRWVYGRQGAGGRSTAREVWLYSPISCPLQPDGCTCVSTMVLGWSVLVVDGVDWGIEMWGVVNLCVVS